MIHRAVVYVLVLSLAGCSSHPAEPPPETQPESRLRAVEDGGSGLLFDSELGISCWMTSWDGTHAWCVPPLLASQLPMPSPPVYADSGCSVLAVPSLDPAAKISAYPYNSLSCEPNTFYRIGEVHSGKLYYGAPYNCVPFDPPQIAGVTFHVAEGPVELGAFASATLFHEEGQRLNQVSWKLADGSRVTTRNSVFYKDRYQPPVSLGDPLYFDSERSELCVARRACDGKVRCMPFIHMQESDSRYGLLRGDSLCQKALGRVYPECFYHNTSAFPANRRDCFTYSRTGASIQNAPAALQGGRCILGATGPADFHVVEEPLPDSAFAELPVEVAP